MVYSKKAVGLIQLRLHIYKHVSVSESTPRILPFFTWHTLLILLS